MDESERFLLVNRIKCNTCKQVIQSYHGHDMKGCKCSKKEDSKTAVYVDGGTNYTRRAGNLTGYTEMSLYSDSPFEDIRKVFRWGSTLDKTGNPRKNIKWEALYTMSKTHIKAILEGNFAEKYRFLFEQELKFREENYAN